MPRGVPNPKPPVAEETVTESVPQSEAPPDALGLLLALPPEQLAQLQARLAEEQKRKEAEARSNEPVQTVLVRFCNTVVKLDRGERVTHAGGTYAPLQITKPDGQYYMPAAEIAEKAADGTLVVLEGSEYLGTVAPASSTAMAMSWAQVREIIDASGEVDALNFLASTQAASGLDPVSKAMLAAEVGKAHLHFEGEFLALLTA